MTLPPDTAALVEQQAAYVWTLESQARVGSYQHEVSSAPWVVLAGERSHLHDMLARANGARDESL